MSDPENQEPVSPFDPAFDYVHLDFVHLDRVMPLGQSMIVGDAAITITSVEIYQEGFNAVLLVEQDAMTSPVLAGNGHPGRPRGPVPG